MLHICQNMGVQFISKFSFVLYFLYLKKRSQCINIAGHVTTKFYSFLFKNSKICISKQTKNTNQKMYNSRTTQEQPAQTNSIKFNYVDSILARMPTVSLSALLMCKSDTSQFFLCGTLLHSTS